KEFYVYNGDNAWADANGTGVVTARYLFGNRIDELLARHQGERATLWYLTDRLGTVRDLTDDSDNLLNHIKYDSYGNVVAHTNPPATDRYLFTGREYDAGIGAYYYRARYYEPDSGSFTSQDPLGLESGDTSPYRYVFNSPVNGTDPRGNSFVEKT